MMASSNRSAIALNSWVGAAVLLLAAGSGLYVLPVVAADSATPATVVQSGPVAPDDFSGIWLTDRNRINGRPSFNNRDPTKPLKMNDGTIIPFRPEAEKIFRARIKMDQTDQPYAGTTARCLPPGTPYNMMGAPFPLHIVQTSDFVAILLEEGWTYRAVYLNGQHPAQLIPNFMGDSVGHWEGKTLVIDTIGIREDVPLTGNGMPHSAQLHLVERITREAPDTLLDRIEVDDPVDYEKPFTFLAYFTRTQERPIEYICEINNIEVSPEGRQVYHDIK